MRGAVAWVERCGARPARGADGASRGVAWRGGAGRRRRGRLWCRGGRGDSVGAMAFVDLRWEQRRRPSPRLRSCCCTAAAAGRRSTGGRGGAQEHGRPRATTGGLRRARSHGGARRLLYRSKLV
ncbi:hypothetical protein ACP70R_045547 [Stipagrostis hirtigluma subsp. patula]